MEVSRKITSGKVTTYFLLTSLTWGWETPKGSVAVDWNCLFFFADRKNLKSNEVRTNPKTKHRKTKFLRLVDCF